MKSPFLTLAVTSKLMTDVTGRLSNYVNCELFKFMVTCNRRKLQACAATDFIIKQANTDKSFVNIPLLGTRLFPLNHPTLLIHHCVIIETGNTSYHQQAVTQTHLQNYSVPIMFIMLFKK
jgi:prolipoprotein diacylglyceryltransferase